MACIPDSDGFALKTSILMRHINLVKLTAYSLRFYHIDAMFVCVSFPGKDKISSIQKSKDDNEDTSIVSLRGFGCHWKMMLTPHSSNTVSR